MTILFLSDNNVMLITELYFNVAHALIVHSVIEGYINDYLLSVKREPSPVDTPKLTNAASLLSD